MQQARRSRALEQARRNSSRHTNPSPPIRIIFADDHALVREGMRALIREHDELDLVGEAERGEEVLPLISRERPDVAILDISMPGLSGIDVARLIRQTHPNVKILIVTIHDDETYINELAGVGVNGYILKNADKETIVRGIHAVTRGERFFDPATSQKMIDQFIKDVSIRPGHPRSNGTLTKRETEILRHIANGLTNKEIAATLWVSHNTVNTHRMHIMRKLGIHETAGLVKYALRNGLTKPRF